MADPVASRILDFASRDPGRVALHVLRSDSKGVFRDDPLTFGAWVEGALACAAALRERGLRRGDRVLLCMPTGRPFVEAFLGAQLIGVVPVPLPSLEGFGRPAAFVNRLSSVVQDAAPSAVFADPRTAEHLRKAGLLGVDLPVVEPAAPGVAHAPQPEPAVADEDLRGLDLSSLRAAINGAEPVDPATAEAFCARLAPAGFSAANYFPVYGLAECTLSVAFPPLGRGVKIDYVRRDELARGRAIPIQPGPGAMRVVSVGPAIFGHEVQIVDPKDHTPLHDRVVGEIWVDGPSISPWYFDRHQAVR